MENMEDHFPSFWLLYTHNICMIGCIPYCDIYAWDLSKFSHVPTGYWNDITNQRSFISDVVQELKIGDQEGWYSRLTCATLRKHGGSGLLEKYNGSTSKLLTTLYPEYRQKCRNLVEAIMHDMKLSKMEDLIGVPVQYPLCSHQTLTLYQLHLP